MPRRPDREPGSLACDAPQAQGAAAIWAFSAVVNPIGFRILGAIVVGSAARTAPALLALPIQQELGWRLSDVVWPLTLAVAVTALAAPLAAYCLERVSVRSLLSSSLVLLAASLLLSTFARSPWQLDLSWGVGMGLGGAVSASVLGGIVDGRAAEAHCGSRFGLLASMQSAGSAVGLLLVPLLAGALGWRSVFYCATIATLAIALAIAVPSQTSRTLSPNLKSLRRDPGENRAVVSYERWRFLVFAAVFFICGGSSVGLADGKLTALCAGGGGDVGSTNVMAAILLGSAIGSVVSGHVADRYRARSLLAFYLGARAIALFWLPSTSLSLVELSQFGAFFGLDAALSFPLLVRLMSANLGGRSPVMMMGWMTVTHAAGAAIASAMMGTFRLVELGGGFILAGIGCLLAACLITLLNDAPVPGARPTRLLGLRRITTWVTQRRRVELRRPRQDSLDVEDGGTV
jgi:predicted MFS family arabinose efflux permease